MPTSAICRLIVDPPSDGAWNMSVDEALLAWTAEDRLPTLRVYQWQRPTLSLGYFQRHDDRHLHAAGCIAEVVRRLSGGGAIVHDRELTYSLALHRSHPLASDTQRLYDLVHEAIMQLLRRRFEAVDAPWEPVLCQGSAPARPRHESFLCFERRAPGDILLRSTTSRDIEHKIVGSAQRRRRGVVLQHGSMLLGRSCAAPQLPGCADLTSHPWPADEIVPEVAQVVLGKLDLKPRITELSTATRSAAGEIRRERYSQSDWTERR